MSGLTQAMDWFFVGPGSMVSEDTNRYHLHEDAVGNP